MSQELASQQQPLIPTVTPGLEGGGVHDPEDQTVANQQRKCGVHLLQQQQAGIPSSSPLRENKQAYKKRSVDAVVEAYLDEHPAFLEAYVRRKVSRRLLEQWLFLPQDHNPITTSLASSDLVTSSPKKVSRGPFRPWIQHASDPHLHKTGSHLSACARGQLPPNEDGGQQERQRSHSFTPLRKVSATTFEAGGLATPILATTSDGQPSFLRTISSAVRTSASSRHPPPMSEDKNEGTSGDRQGISNRKDLLLSLLPDIIQLQDLSSMAQALMKSANLLMGQPARVELLWVPNEAAQGTAFRLKNDHMTRFEDPSEVIQNNPLLQGLLLAPKIVNLKEGETLAIGSVKVKSALLGPIFRPDGTGKLMGCLQLYDKEGGFSADDEALFRHLLKFTSTAMSNLLFKQEMRLELTRSEVFLELARTVFREPTRLETTMLIILTNFLALIDCQKCQISLCDRDRPTVFKRVFDLERKDLQEKHPKVAFEDRLPMKSHLTGQVALTGQKVNINCNELALNGQTDQEESVLHSFLSLPIRDPDGIIVGVISLANKEMTTSSPADPGEAVINQVFTNNDERFVEAFTVFCGMAIRNASDYERAVLSEAKLQVAFEVMNFQAASNADDASQLATLPIPAAASVSIDSFDFNYLNMDENATLTATVRFFIDLGLLKQFSIDHSTLCRWLLTVKRNYRNETVKYHNWYHAFNVTQMMFGMMLKTGWHWKFSPIEVLGLIVACISHDLDHRGTNNSFQHKMNNPLAKLYATSTLERHHLNQCLLILTLKGNQILDNLTKDEYSEALAVIERSILATDLALHFRDAPALSTLSSNINQSDTLFQELIENNDANRQLLQAGMMTAADLGHAVRPWDNHCHVSQLVAEEFWTQGDIERKEFNIEPQPMFDRSVALNVVQVEFLDNPCMPLYEDMVRFSEHLQPLLDGCRANRKRWVTLAVTGSAEEEDQRPSDLTGESVQARNL